MIRFVADEDFNRRIVVGLLRRIPLLDIVRIQDKLGIGGRDEDLLEWASHEQRVLLSHDVNTLVPKAVQRTASGAPMSGLIIVPQSVSIGTAIVELELVASCGVAEDFQNQIVFLPLR
jgi:hypothetical protein